MLDKISVVVPVYNVEKYLERCVNSIINQTYRNLEIILVDDGSTDQSGKICDDFERKDSRIKVIHKKNGGLSDARNVGLKIACGEYIGYVDSDDWIELDMYETLHQMIQLYDADIAMCASNSVDCEGKRVDLGTVPSKRNGFDQIIIYEGKQMMEAHLSARNLINAGVWNKLYRRSVTEGIEFPVGRLYEDVFTMYKYLDRASKLVKTNTHKYNYFQRDDSICRKNFSFRNFDSVDANAIRYEFIEMNYPELEPMARERALVNILNIGFRLAKSGQISQFSTELKKAVKVTRTYSINGCGLNCKQIIGLLLLRLNVHMFSKAVTMMYL